MHASLIYIWHTQQRCSAVSDSGLLRCHPIPPDLFYVPSIHGRFWYKSAFKWGKMNFSINCLVLQGCTEEISQFLWHWRGVWWDKCHSSSTKEMSSFANKSDKSWVMVLFEESWGVHTAHAWSLPELSFFPLEKLSNFECSKVHIRWNYIPLVLIS